MMKRILKLYFSSWWLPALLFFVLLGSFTTTAMPRWEVFAFVANGLFCLMALAFIGVLAAAMWSLIKQRWAKGIINVLLVFVCGAAAIFAFGVIMFTSMFGPSEDGLPTT